MSRARAIETRLEKQLPVLNEFFTSGFLTRDEIRELTRQRTHWEYRLVAKPLLLLDVQHAILYELSIEEKLQHYCVRSKLTLKHRWSVLERIEGIYRIGLKNLHNAAESEMLRSEYVQFLKRFSRHASLSRMYAQMMIKFPTREDIWTEAALYEGMENNNMDNARVIIQRAIANMGQHSRVWCGALELELHFASRLLNGVVEEFEQEMLKRQETNMQTVDSSSNDKETEVMLNRKAEIEREAKELPSKLRNENEAMAHIMLDLALAQGVIDEAMVSKACHSPQLVKEMINVIGKYEFTRELLEHLLNVALRDGIKQVESNHTNTVSQKTREEWKMFLPTLICNFYLVKEDIYTNYFTRILVTPETYLQQLGGDNKLASSNSKVLEKKRKVKVKRDALISCVVHLYEFMYQCSICVEEREVESCIASTELTAKAKIVTMSVDRRTLFSQAFNQLECKLRELAHYEPDGVSSVCRELINMAMIPHNTNSSTKDSKNENNNESKEEMLSEETTKAKTKKKNKAKVMRENENVVNANKESDNTNFIMISAFMLECLTTAPNQKNERLVHANTLQAAQETVNQLCSLLHWVPETVPRVPNYKSDCKQEKNALDSSVQDELRTHSMWRTLPVNRLISLICDGDDQSELLKNVWCTSSSAEIAQLSAGELHCSDNDDENNNNSKSNSYSTKLANTKMENSNIISRSHIEAFILWWKTQAKNANKDNETAVNKTNVDELENQESIAPHQCTQNEDYCVERRQMLVSFMNAHGLLPQSTSYATTLRCDLSNTKNNDSIVDKQHSHDNFTCERVASLLLSRSTIEHIRQCIRKWETNVNESEEEQEHHERKNVHLHNVAKSFKCTVNDSVMIWKLYNAMELMDGRVLNSTSEAKRPFKTENTNSDSDSDEEETTNGMNSVSNNTTQQTKQNVLHAYSSYAIAGLHLLSFFTHDVRNRSLQMECTHGIYCLMRSALYNLTQLKKKQFTREHIVHVLLNNCSDVGEIFQFDAKCDELIHAVKLTSSPVSRYCYVSLILPVIEGLCLFYKQLTSHFHTQNSNNIVNMDNWFAHCRERCHYWLQMGRAVHESIIKLYTLTQHRETYVPLIYCGNVNATDNSIKHTLEERSKKRSRSDSATESYNTSDRLLLLQQEGNQLCSNRSIKDNVNEYNTLDWLSYIIFERSVANDLQKSLVVVERARREVLDPQLFITKLNCM